MQKYVIIFLKIPEREPPEAINHFWMVEFGGPGAVWLWTLFDTNPRFGLGIPLPIKNKEDECVVGAWAVIGGTGPGTITIIYGNCELNGVRSIVSSVV